jgi:putative methionine-R-sulfoxide reductase with GAF domain
MAKAVRVQVPPRAPFSNREMMQGGSMRETDLLCCKAGGYLDSMQDSKALRYERVRAPLAQTLLATLSIEARIMALVDALWAEFGEHRPISWVGFYWMADGEMTLGPRRDKPACSPIGLNGACGKAALTGASLLVADVRALGPNYIACDPRDLAELVVPVRGADGRVIGVMDLDSYSVGAFDLEDQAAIEGLVREFLEQGK